MDDDALQSIEVVVANLHLRYTGVTATARSVTPFLARRLSVCWFGTDAPENFPRLTLRNLLQLRGRRTPVIWHARRNDEMITGVLLKLFGWPFRLVFTSAAQRYHSWITRWLMSRMDAIISTSAASASYLNRPTPVVHHGVDATLYVPPVDRDAAFAEAGLPGRYAIGCFGRVRAQKGTDLFVTAMCELLPRYPDFSAVIIGAITPDQTNFAAILRDRIERAGLSSRLRVLGELETDEVVRWFQRLTVYAFTSRIEGHGMTLFEAMSTGVAVVAARAGAAELAIEDGRNGYLIPTGDAAALIAAVEPLMRDPRLARDVGERARSSITERFSLDKEADGIAAVYRSLL